MAVPHDDDYDVTSNSYIPRAARTVPQSEVLHTIEFHKISHPLTEHAPELWVVEINQRGHRTWWTLESFLTDFDPSAQGISVVPCNDSSSYVDTQARRWREHYGIPDPFPQGGPPSRVALRRHVLPQHAFINSDVENSGWLALIPDQQPLLRACWGCSAFRHSQENPASSLLVTPPHQLPHPPASSTSSTIPAVLTSDRTTSHRRWTAPASPPATPTPTRPMTPPGSLRE